MGNKRVNYKDTCELKLGIIRHCHVTMTNDTHVHSITIV